MSWLKPVTLCGTHCTLKPLSIEHCSGLIDAVSDGELWNLNYTLIPRAEAMEQEITRRLELQSKGLMLPFVVIHNESQKIIGMTSYCQINAANRRLDIGFTWYAKSYQRTAVNTECKYILLTHAFEILDCIAVGFRVDYLNQPSRKAVERLGAKFEGTIRNYAIMPNGNMRDMCFYSILPHEWPTVKFHLECRLAFT